MQLTHDNINDITFGVENVVEKNGFFAFQRFSYQAMELYKKLRGHLYNKTFSTAGVRLSFMTNSRTMEFDYKIEESVATRKFGYFDVYQNGVLIEHFGCEGVDNGIEHIKLNFSNGDKHIEIYFPWSARVLISNVIVENNSYVNSSKREKTMICYGDSITQGYDALYPSLSYSNRIAHLLNADIKNKAIGGDIFFPELLDVDVETNADIVVVAYGTNDWNVLSYDEIIRNCKSFYEKVSDKYTNSKIIAITPIWRADGNKKVNAGILNSEMDYVIRSICNSNKKINVINGQYLTPHNEEFYLDKRLHPNDLGFGIYVNNLYKEILKNCM